MSYPGLTQQRGSGGSSVEYYLRGNTSYKAEFRPRIVKDVEDVLRQLSSLKPEIDVYFANDGTSLPLLKMKGTVPIFYRGSQYNIPMSFWVSKDYPLTPPLVYVTPTATMQLDRNHDHVSPDGKVFLPYLNQWNSSRSNLNGLISTCKAVFSNFPPVHAKAPGGPSPPAYGQQGRSSGPGYPTSSPGYPTSSTGYPGATSTPPPPPYQQAAGVPTGIGRSGMSSLPPPPAASDVVRRTSDEEKARNEVRKQNELKATRQAVEIKLKEHFRKFREKMKKELTEEMKTQSNLEEGQRKLEEGMEKLESQKKDFEEAIDELSMKRKQLETWLAEYEGSSDSSSQDSAIAQMSLDEAIVPVDTPSRQLFDCVAESNAIEDILYHLDRSLGNDTIDLQTFLKEVRKLARRQFMAKALAKKIQKYQQKIEMQNRQPPSLNSMPPAYSQKS